MGCSGRSEWALFWSEVSVQYCKLSVIGAYRCDLGDGPTTRAGIPCVPVQFSVEAGALMCKALG